MSGSPCSDSSCQDWLVRSGQFAYLARWLAAPPDEPLRRLEEEENLLAAGDGGSVIGPSRVPTLEDLQVEHAALFAAPGPRFVHSSESVYCDRFSLEFTGCGMAGPTPVIPVDRLLWGPTTPAILATYRAAGWDVPPGSSYPPDHIALELAFYARLLAAAAERATEAEDAPAPLAGTDPDTAAHAASAAENARTFFEQHLDRWAPAFFRRILARPGLIFYDRVARVGLEWLEAERGCA